MFHHSLKKNPKPASNMFQPLPIKSQLPTHLLLFTRASFNAPSTEAASFNAPSTEAKFIELQRGSKDGICFTSFQEKHP